MIFSEAFSDPPSKPNYQSLIDIASYCKLEYLADLMASTSELNEATILLLFDLPQVSYSPRLN